MLRKITYSFFIGLISVFSGITTSFSQEFFCEVNVQSNPKLLVTTVDKEVIGQLKEVIEEFMNNTRWTKDEFEIEERINCALQISIEKIPSTGNYEGSIQIQASRPVYNSNYNSTLFSFKDDDFIIRFDRNQILQYSPNQFRDNLTSILAFYAYMILGYDYDSFSPQGGTKHFEMAQQIVSLASTGQGWNASDSRKRNRFYLIDNALQQLFSPLRDAYYIYHRSGLDVAYVDIAKCREEVYNALKLLESVQQTRPGSVNVQIFLSAKINELKGLYSKAEIDEKNKVIALLKKLDPANASKYDEILTT